MKYASARTTGHAFSGPQQVRHRGRLTQPVTRPAGGPLQYDFYPGRSGDGMKVDAEGNLWVAAGWHRRPGSSETLNMNVMKKLKNVIAKAVAWAWNNLIAEPIDGVLGVIWVPSWRPCRS